MTSKFVNIKAPIIGVLALQGNFSAHAAHLSKLNISSKEIREVNQLSKIDGLIIPGGESTTILKFFETAPWKEEIIKFSKQRPIFGTCAGAIILAEQVENPVQNSLGLLPIRIFRNGYGRQKDSFYKEVHSSIFNGDPIKCFFIRAPVIKSVLDQKVEVLAKHEGHPILLRYRNILCSTFHSELSDDLKVHRLFLSMV